ncbi:MAG TPA: hypothetical protein VHU21_22630 [Paraburkholderia sp.]|nr:hypothetical protein [Paraburkholderia sp.]
MVPRDPRQSAAGHPPRSSGATTTIRRTLSNRKNLSFVAWVAIGTGSVFLTLALPLPALGAFVIGACCAYAGHDGRRRDARVVVGYLGPPARGDGADQRAPPVASPNETNDVAETEDEASTP